MQKVLGHMRKAIQEFDLIQDGDRIAVGIPGTEPLYVPGER